MLVKSAEIRVEPISNDSCEFSISVDGEEAVYFGFRVEDFIAIFGVLIENAAENKECTVGIDFEVSEN